MLKLTLYLSVIILLVELIFSVKRLKKFTVLTRSVLLCLLSLGIISLQFQKEIPKSDLLSDRVMITALHLPTKYFPEHDLIYSDSDTDTAVYLRKQSYINYTAYLNREVTLSELKGVITEINQREFLVQLDEPDQIIGGLSGSRVVCDGTAIGFVSALTEGSLLKCYFF